MGNLVRAQRRALKLERKQGDTDMAKQGWEVLDAIAVGAYGLHVRGVNHDAADEIDRRFSWTIDHYSAASPRYDWTGCKFGAGAAERLEKLQAIAAARG
jgi:hypothetical protein